MLCFILRIVLYFIVYKWCRIVFCCVILCIILSFVFVICGLLYCSVLCFVMLCYIIFCCVNEGGNQSENRDQNIRNDNDNKVTNNNKSRCLNNNQNLNNNYGNTDTTEVNNNHSNPSNNIIRVYTRQTNNDNNTNTIRISNNYTIPKEDLPVFSISQQQRIQPVELEEESSTRFSSPNPNNITTIEDNLRTSKLSKLPTPYTQPVEILFFRSQLPQQPQLSHRCYHLPQPCRNSPFRIHLPQPPQFFHRCIHLHIPVDNLTFRKISHFSQPIPKNRRHGDSSRLQVLQHWFLPQLKYLPLKICHQKIQYIQKNNL